MGDQGVHFWVPSDGPNAVVLAAGGVFRSTAPIAVQASDASWSAAISVNIRTQAVTETIELQRNETSSVFSAWTSNAAFTLSASSAYFLATDAAIGPSSGVWWGSSSSVVTVPLHSSCGGATVTATFKAQQTACGSTWRTDPALDSCELRTLAGRPVVIEAR